MNYEIGTVIGDYQIVGVLGTGGMGKVYKVRNTISDRIEAMKILLPNLDADQELAERFLREIKVQASLQHPNIASLRTAQRVNNQLLMIMEFVEGSTIEALMRQQRIPLQDCMNYGSQVLAALSYAHAHGVVHRDIKPPNIMLTPDGVIKLMDFGIAKIGVDHRLTQAGKTVGSLFYMSPEQIRGTDVDGRSDLYSLGITLYEMVTGRRPFEGESDYSIMAAHLQQQPHPPVYFDASLPQALNDVILMSIAKDPAQRFQTADAFRGALESVGKGLGVGAATGSGGTQIFARPVMPPPAPPTPPSGRQRTPTVMEGPPSQPQMPAMPPPPPQHVQPQMPPPQYAQAQTTGGRSHRGLYMVLGSVVTIGILAAAAFYGPKLLKTRASGEPTQTSQVQPPLQQQTPPVQQQQPPVPQQAPPVQQQEPIQQPPAPVQQQPVHQAPPPQQVAKPQHTTTVPVVTPPIQTPPQAPPPTQQVPQQAPVQQPPVQQAPGMPQPTTAVPKANPVNSELEELNHRQMLLHTRIDAINASMTQLEQQQRRMGLGMNGDLVARQHRMVFFMETADAAMRKGNVAQARTSLDNAERELDKLEEHFGR